MYSTGKPLESGEKIGSGTHAGTVVSTHVHIDERGDITNVALIEYPAQPSDFEPKAQTS